MTPDDLSTMTLRELEELAKRMETAARTIRDAMSLLGGAQTNAGPHVPPAIIHQDGYRLEPALGTNRIPPQQPSHPNLMTPERLQRLEELRMDPARDALLKQFAKDGGKEEEAPVRRETIDTVPDYT